MRYERKYRIEGLSLSVIMQSIRLHPASLRKIYPDRQINNIYFDTVDFTTYKENVMGIANRKKYRVRWYGANPFNIQKPKFEIKHRNNEVGTKNIYDVAPFTFADLSGLSKEVNQKSETFADLKPVLLNSYARAYFGTNDKKFRVTVDWDLRYASLLKTQRFSGYQAEEESVFVVEVKYDKELEQEVDRITQHFPYRRTKNSKYVNGVELCW